MPQQFTISFDIHAFKGALPILFGMHRDEVHRLIGTAESSGPIWNKTGFSQAYASGAYNVGYDNNWLVNHLGFGPGHVTLLIEGQLIWSHDQQPDPNPILLAHDPHPVERVGFWIFPLLGVTTTGYHDDDINQRALTVFSRARLPYFLASARAKPADTSRYSSARKATHGS